MVSLQFSSDGRYILTSVAHHNYQELVLWDLPNFRYMRDNVKLAADRIQWHDSICSGSEDVRAIWENANLAAPGAGQPEGSPRRTAAARLADPARHPELARAGTAINLSCHRLTRQQGAESLVIASDARGHLRLFRYPCYDIRQGFFAIRISSGAVNCCRFLNSADPNFISASLDGSICLWALN